MRTQLLLGTVTAGLAFLTACDLEDFADAGSSRYTEDFHYAHPLKAGGRLSVENFNGSIEISSWNENSVEINGTKYAPTEELRDAIKIDVSAQPDTIYVRTVRPSARRGNMGARYFIRVPRKVQLERIASSNGPIRVVDVDGPARLKTSNGAVRTENLRGTLDVQTSNGGIEVRNQEGGAVLRTSNGRIRAEAIRGMFEAFTSNGGITAQIAATDQERPVRVETTNGGVDLVFDAATKSDVRVSTSNGGITVRLPDKMNARLIAVTSNSTVRSDFDVQSTGPASKHRLEGNLGSGGGPAIDLSTTNGSIRILRQ